jgi:uncharacterized protein YqgC (DUF456 family)
MTYALWLLSVALVGVGLAGTVLPALPGIPLILSGLVVGAYVDNFERVTLPTILVLVILTVVGFAIDYFAALLGAKRAGASRLALVGAALGTLLGFALGIVGFLFGPFLGAAVGELVARQDLLRAGKVGFQTWIGMLIGSAAKVAIAFTMVGIFVGAYLWWN